MFFELLGLDWRLKYLPIQRKLYLDADKELSHKEYERMVRAAEKSDKPSVLKLRRSANDSCPRKSKKREVTQKYVDFRAEFCYTKIAILCIYLINFRITGSQLRRALRFMLREEAFTDGDHCEWYQISRGLCCEYDRPTHTILSLKMNGKEVDDDEVFSAAMERYHYLSIASFLGLTHEELEKDVKSMEVASRTANVLEEYFTRHELLKLDGEPRLIIHE